MAALIEDPARRAEQDKFKYDGAGVDGPINTAENGMIHASNSIAPNTGQAFDSSPWLAVSIFISLLYPAMMHGCN